MTGLDVSLIFVALAFLVIGVQALISLRRRDDDER